MFSRVRHGSVWGNDGIAPISLNLSQMEVSGQIHHPAALCAGRRSVITRACDAGMEPGKGKNFLSLLVIEPVRGLGTISTTLFRSKLLACSSFHRNSFCRKTDFFLKLQATNLQQLSLYPTRNAHQANGEVHAMTVQRDYVIR